MDDILIFGLNEEAIQPMKQKLQSFHTMKDSGLVTKILSIRITWEKSRILLDQKAYSEEILIEFGMDNSKTTAVPLSSSVSLLQDDSPKLSEDEHNLYQQIIGCLMFLTTTTCPDLQYTVNTLSQFLSDPQDVHLQAAKHVLHYLHGTLGYRLSYAKGSTGSSVKGSPNVRLIGYVDSSYTNTLKACSTSRSLFYLQMSDSLITWTS